MRWAGKALFSLMLMGLFIAPQGWAAEHSNGDVVIYKDGRKKTGKIQSETETAVYLEIEEGEVLPIAKSRIDHVVRSGANTQVEPQKVLPEGDAAAPPKRNLHKPKPGPTPKVDPETKRIYDSIKDLGHSSRDLRNATMKRTLDIGFRAVPVILAFYNPRQKVSPELKIGGLRALAELGPLDNTAAKTLGWVAMKAQNREVMREACRTIQCLKEDRALQYILGFATSKDRGAQVSAARALREINDDRSFAALAGSVPPPKVNANVPQASAKVREIPNMPLGNGLRGTLFLPENEVMGTAENLMSKPAETLTMIAGKKLGGSPGVWINWLNEKVGVWTQRERQEASRNRGSVLNKMGSPQTQK